MPSRQAAEGGQALVPEDRERGGGPVSGSKPVGRGGRVRLEGRRHPAGGAADRLQATAGAVHGRRLSRPWARRPADVVAAEDRDVNQVRCAGEDAAADATSGRADWKSVIGDLAIETSNR